MSYTTKISENHTQEQELERLRGKLEQCEKLQPFMKDVNAYFRKYGTCKGAPGVSDELAAKLDNKITTTRYSWEKQPYSSYTLTNNNAEIKRLKNRVAEFERKCGDGYVGWEFKGGEAVINNEIDRLQLIFDERPSKEQCAVLKHNGFKWSPTNGAWQRQLTGNAMYSANRIEFIKPSSGESVLNIQPKSPRKEEQVR
jgi:hypothetical protein